MRDAPCCDSDVQRAWERVQVIAQDYRKGQRLVAERNFQDNAAFFQVIGGIAACGLRQGSPAFNAPNWLRVVLNQLTTFECKPEKVFKSFNDLFAERDNFCCCCD